MRAFRVWHVSLVMLVAVVACDSSGVSSVKPSVNVDQTPVDFGLEAVGDTSAPRSVKLNAISATPVTISDVTVTTTFGGESAFALDGTAPQTVPARGTIEIGVVFSPKAVATYSGELKFKTNDAEHPEFTVLLTGEGKSPQVEVTPNAITLAAKACPANATSVQCKDQESVTIENKGLVRLTLPSVAVAAAEGESTVPANLKLAKLVNTKTLEPGEKLEVTVVWTPRGDADPSKDQVGDFKAKLAITTNDPAKPAVSIPIAAHSDPAGTPQSCINVLSVMQRQYVNGTAQYVSVKPKIWEDAGSTPDPKLIHVRPGMKITFTSKRVKAVLDGNNEVANYIVDADAEQMNPCTFDPTGDAITRTWATPTRPSQSRAGVTPKSSGADGEIEIDAAGDYVVGLTAANTLNIKGTSTFAIDAQPRDDLFVQLEWQDAQGVDFDLHVLADQGPGLTTTGSLFCTQDCFFFNANPTWFTQSTGDMIPHFLRDDQGTAAQLESFDLIKAPEGTPSRFRVAVHLYDTRGMSIAAKPKITIRHLNQTFGPFTPTNALTKENDTWYAAQVDFAGDGSAPTVTALTGAIVTVEPPDLTTGQVSMCP